MEKDIKREALRRYLKYFKVWFIIAGILAVITIGVAVVHLLTPKTVRGNSQDPTERVFDYADMLTDEEEQSLREYIAECEEKIQADIVIVTISESVEYDLQNPGLEDQQRGRNLPWRTGQAHKYRHCQQTPWSFDNSPSSLYLPHGHIPRR